MAPKKHDMKKGEEKKSTMSSAKRQHFLIVFQCVLSFFGVVVVFGQWDLVDIIDQRNYSSCLGASPVAFEGGFVWRGGGSC